MGDISASAANGSSGHSNAPPSTGRQDSEKDGSFPGTRLERRTNSGSMLEQRCKRCSGIDPELARASFQNIHGSSADRGRLMAVFSNSGSKLVKVFPPAAALTDVQRLSGRRRGGPASYIRILRSLSGTRWCTAADNGLYVSGLIVYPDIWPQ